MARREGIKVHGVSSKILAGRTVTTSFELLGGGDKLLIDTN